MKVQILHRPQKESAKKRMKIIPLTPRDINCLLKYFKAVDLTLAKRFNLSFEPNEEHLTAVLCELLDSNGTQLHQLTYSLEELNKDLSEKNGILQAEINIKTSQYNKHQEGHNTQADLGIIIEYIDNFESSNSFKKGILIQAKRLFLDVNERYSLESKYDSFSDKQHGRASNLIQSFQDKGCGNNCLIYLLYNPSLITLASEEVQKTIYYQLKSEHNNIYDYTIGLQRYNELLNRNDETDIISPGAVFAEIDLVHKLAATEAKNNASKKVLIPFTLDSLVKNINIQYYSLPYFIVFNLIAGLGEEHPHLYDSYGCECSELIRLVEYGEEILTEKQLNVLSPQYTIVIKIIAGSERQG